MQKESPLIAPLIRPTSHVRRESLTEQTVRTMREGILDGTYALGQKLKESELVSRFGVSSSVIREALHVLQGEGIVVTRPYCGRSVISVPPEEGSELIVMRAWLESYAAYLAAQKMTPRMAQVVRAAAGRFVADSPASYSDWVDRELEFHRAVWDASCNERLIRQLNQFTSPIFTLRIVETSRIDGDVRKQWQNSQTRETTDNPQGHQALARTIINGDAKKARKIMLRHILPEPNETQREMLQL
jgi:DNA-binding GntR family transcriptional regulator